FADGVRAVVMDTASVQGAVRVKGADGEAASTEHALDDRLLPVVEGHAAEDAVDPVGPAPRGVVGSVAAQGYAVERAIRDAKVDALYEGSTDSQGQDYLFRKIVRNQGAALNSLAEDIKKFLALGTGGEELAGAREHLAKAAVELEAVVGLMLTDLAATEQDVKNIYKVGLNTTRLLMASGDVVVGYLLLKGAAVAAEKLPT